MYDYIIVMDNNNLRNLSYIIGEDTEHKVYKMMSFVGENRMQKTHGIQIISMKHMQI